MDTRDVGQRSSRLLLVKEIPASGLGSDLIHSKHNVDKQINCDEMNHPSRFVETRNTHFCLSDLTNLSFGVMWIIVKLEVRTGPPRGGIRSILERGCTRS